MSTPSFVTLPRGVQRTEFVGGHAPLAGWIAAPEKHSRGTILLIPGFTGSKEDFITLMPYLRELGYSVASYDHRGQFESTGPQSPDGYAMADFVSDSIAVAHQLVERTGQRLHLVGHSFGGLVARTATIQQLSEEVGSGTDPILASLTLMASGVAAVPGDLQVLASQFVAFLPDTPLEVIWEHKEFVDRENDPNPPDSDLYAFLRHRFISNNPFALQAKAQILIEIGDAVDDLAHLSATAQLPLLVAFGENDDRWQPAEQEAMAYRLGARRVLLPGAAHSPNTEQPELCTAGLEAFFADVSNTTGCSIAFPSGARGYTHRMELRTPVDNSPAGVGVARRTVVRQLEAWGLVEAIDDMQIVVSELVTNAVRYGKNPVELRLRINGDLLRIEVFDGNTVDIPQPRQATHTESTGRGMPLIDALAIEWGVDVTETQKVVWADVAMR
ncbi:MAG: alpha/beta fold hydrolase [Candidatus Nanopelagicales bacterium]